MHISPYNIEVDKIDQNSWNRLLTQFEDASIFQTWSYGISSRAGKKVSHIVLKEGEETLGCCHVCLRQIPFFDIGIADIKWGPLFLKKGVEFKPDVLFHLMHAIKEEYAINKRYLIRIVPHAVGERKELLKKILDDQNFKRNNAIRAYRTLILDISPDLVDLRKNFLQKWRNCLNKAERNNIVVIEGTSDDLFNKSVMIAKEMGKRKDITSIAEYYERFRRLQKTLNESFKMKIMLCEVNNEPICTAVCSAIGNKGILLLAATGKKALELNASYLLQWNMIQWMKSNNIRYYDLGAFNPQLNPGGYHFKLGVAGKKGWEEIFIGEFYGYFNVSGRIMKYILDCLRFINGIIEKLKTK